MFEVGGVVGQGRVESEEFVPRKGILFSTIFFVQIIGYPCVRQFVVFFFLPQYFRVIDVCFDLFWFLLQISFEQMLRNFRTESTGVLRKWL